MWLFANLLPFYIGDKVPYDDFKSFRRFVARIQGAARVFKEIILHKEASHYLHCKKESVLTTLK